MPDTGRFCKYNHDTEFVGRNKNGECKTCMKLRGLKQKKHPGYRNKARRQYSGMIGVPDEPVNGTCDICHNPFEKTPHADHDHSTDLFRGWLCNACNTGLGFFRDDPRNLASAIIYLHNHQLQKHETARPS